ncbi:phosphoprotein phosphatase inhibitor [Rhynchospora pubera]|uniref:Phosphoprotein phosphatase inhibitor n=1 Tax=Rhynchospora pubera TaxID=906938 RepID=A0AAV8HBX8_9POAL|nr:phosphoprotein phosphatase inhibitor [Rhynchospora pubera]
MVAPLATTTWIGVTSGSLHFPNFTTRARVWLTTEVASLIDNTRLVFSRETEKISTGPLISRRHVTWNEENLHEIESTKLVRQKINEPRTPYLPMIDVVKFHCSKLNNQYIFRKTLLLGLISPRRAFDECIDESLHLEAIATTLNDVASSSKSTTSNTADWSSSDDETDHNAMDQDEDSDTERARKSFTEHRKAHYNEFKKVKELMRTGSLVDDVMVMMMMMMMMMMISMVTVLLTVMASKLSPVLQWMFLRGKMKTVNKTSP